MDTHRQMDRSDLSGIRLALTSPCICTSFKTRNTHLMGSLKPSKVLRDLGRTEPHDSPPGWVTSFGCANAWPLPKRKEILSQLPQSFVGLLFPPTLALPFAEVFLLNVGALPTATDSAFSSCPPLCISRALRCILSSLS